MICDFNYNPPSPLADQLASVVDALARRESQRRELWLRACTHLHAPGVYALVQSGQLRAAAAYLAAQSFEIAYFPDGSCEYRRHGQTLSTLPALKLVSNVNL